MHFLVETSQEIESIMERLKGHSCVSLPRINVGSEGSNTNSLLSCDIVQVSDDEILCFGLESESMILWHCRK